jgi:Fe-S-cluster containining protein
MRGKTLEEPRTARVVLGLPAGEIELGLEVPPGLTRVDQLLPMARALTEHIVELTVIQVEEEGRKISCRAGCGACCGQLVPIGEAEARGVRDLVESLPEPQRSRVKARFAQALLRLDAAGLLTPLRARADWDDARRREIGLAYFRQGVACPFLEDESCSIYPERPIACREYLVTSPPEHCADPKVDQVEGVKLPASVWTAVARLDPVEPGAKSIRWVPLILALEWAEAHPDKPPGQPAEELVRRLFDNIARKSERFEAHQNLEPGSSIAS